MPAIPLPFVVALMLTLLLLILLSSERRTQKPVAVFIGALILMVTLVGLRWSTSLTFVRWLQPCCACLVPLLAWRCFSAATTTAPGRFWLRCLLLPLPVIVGFLFLQPVFPDLWIPAITLFYGGKLLRLAAAGQDSFGAVRLSETTSATGAAALTGMLLCVSALTDLLISADVALFSGHHVTMVIAAAQVLVMLALAALIVRINALQPAAEKAAKEPPEITQNVQAQEEDHAIYQRIRQLIETRALYRDPDLTLDRLARKAVIPARKVSQAINRIEQCNVSQLINRYRVQEAQRLLETSTLPVTEVMAEAGFRTKSNFNREFLRIVGSGPQRYRQNLALTAAEAPPERPAPATEN